MEQGTLVLATEIREVKGGVLLVKVASPLVARRLPALSRLSLLLVAPLVQIAFLANAFLADHEICKFRIAPKLFDCVWGARQIARGSRSIEPSRCYVVYVDDDRVRDRTVHAAPPAPVLSTGWPE